MGCEAAIRGITRIHNDRCRERIEKGISVNELDRFNKVRATFSTVEASQSTDGAAGSMQDVGDPALKGAQMREEQSTPEKSCSSGADRETAIDKTRDKSW